MLIIDERKVYLHLKRSDFRYNQPLKIIQWWNKQSEVNGGHEFRKHETALF